MPHADNNSQKYAEALLLLAESAGRVPSVESGLKAIAEDISGNPEMLRFISDDFVKSEGKQELLSELFATRSDPLLILFIRILQLDSKIANIVQISKDFGALVAARSNRVSGELVSAIELPEDKVKAIEEQISQMLNKRVSLSRLVDGDMLGGVSARVGDFVIDGSLDSELSKARSALLE